MFCDEGVRMLDGSVTDLLEAEAVTYNNQYVEIFSASWGPTDDGKTMEGPHRYCERALQEGATKVTHFLVLSIQTCCMLVFLQSACYTRGQSNLTKSTSLGAHSPVRGHPRGSKVVPLNSWGRVSY